MALTMAQRHADKADRLLEQAERAGAEAGSVCEDERELLLEQAERLTARAQAHALTALAIRKTGDRRT